MSIVFLSNWNAVSGYHTDLTAAELVDYPGAFIEVETVPEIVLLTPAGKQPMYNGESEEFYLVDLPPVPDPPEDELAKLKLELAATRQENESLRRDMAEQTSAILDIYDIILGGI